MPTNLENLKVLADDTAQTLALAQTNVANMQNIIDEMLHPVTGEADFFYSPLGAGTKDGSSEENAAQLNGTLDPAIMAVGPGGRIGLIADQGPYTVGSINISHGGEPGKPVLISGIRGNAQFIGTRNNGVSDFDSGRDIGDGTTVWKRPWEKQVSPEGWQPVNSASWGSNGNELFRLLEGANYLAFEHLNPIRRNRAYNMIGNVKEISIRLHDFFNCDSNIFSAYDTPNGWDGLYVSDCTFTGVSNDAVRGTGACKRTRIWDCVGDSGFQTGGKFIMMFFFSEQCDDILIERTVAKNGLDNKSWDPNAYANGDGFVFEREVTNVIVNDSVAESFSDGGIDCKSKDVQLNRCTARWCKRNFRIWGGGTLTDCISIEPRKMVVKNKSWNGGEGSVNDLQVTGGPDAEHPVLVKLVRCPTIQSIAQSPHSLAGGKFYGQVVREN